MDFEASPFESSEMLATFLASTHLIPESWRLCCSANATAHGSFRKEEIGEVVYIAFSGIQMARRFGAELGTAGALG
ncbi:hypothetical protein QN277_025836 [Acacia crassicarpa]|uniref:Uncharacterized protein n=1 Tax=Acacia crassicarpa TaxID=499986 RepID=A0AAE1J6I3_9FABA|nr:hypothetical protein QN277_025836 [Acacia crassicarpa]